jgi:hypothetical protein
MAQPAVAILSQGSNANVVKPVQQNIQIKPGLNIFEDHNQRKSQRKNSSSNDQPAFSKK